MGTRTIPQVDMVNVSKSLQFQRKPIVKFLPPIGLSCINYKTIGEMDHFYLDCQKYRDYSRDPGNKIQRPSLFNQVQGKCGDKPDRNYATMTGPVCWMRERQPVVYPEKYSRRMNLDGRILFDAHYSSNSSVVYKR